jgi:hypothetical protein
MIFTLAQPRRPAEFPRARFCGRSGRIISANKNDVGDWSIRRAASGCSHRHATARTVHRMTQPLRNAVKTAVHEAQIAGLRELASVAVPTGRRARGSRPLAQRREAGQRLLAPPERIMVVPMRGERPAHGTRGESVKPRFRQSTGCQGKGNTRTRPRQRIHAARCRLSGKSAASRTLSSTVITANGMLHPLANCVLPNIGEDRGSRRVSAAPGG